MTDKAVIVGGKTRPWEKRSFVTTGVKCASVEANKAAFDAMSVCERETGWTAEQVREWHQAQRARVLERMREAQP